MEIRAIIFALRQAETGVIVSEVCRKMGISEATAPAARVLQLEKEVRWFRSAGATQTAAVRGGKSAVKTVSGRFELRQTNVTGCSEKKSDRRAALRPAQKRKLAADLLTDYRVPVQRVCEVVCLQRSCCRAAGAVL